MGIYIFGGIKGGGGKTTLATTMAVARAKAGKDVLLLDLDAADNSNASDFTEMRKSRSEDRAQENFTCMSVLKIDTLKEQYPRLAKKYDDIIVDVGGSDSDLQRVSMLHADAYIIPIYPSSYDVWVLGKVARMVETVREFNSKLRAIAVLMRADASGSSNDEVAEIIREIPAFEYHDTPIVNRKVFRIAAANGLIASEVKPRDNKAIEEISSLYDKIFGETYDFRG